MQRRKFLIGLGSLAAGSAAAFGSGATNVIEANRAMNIEVAGDGSAHLTLDAKTSNDFVSMNSDEIEIDFSGSGVNESGSTEVRPAFEMRNRISKTLHCYIVNPYRNNDLSSQPTPVTGPVPGVSPSDRPVGEAGLDVQFVAGTDNFMDLSSSGGSAALIDRTQELPGYGSPFASAEDNATMRTNTSSSSYTNFVNAGSVGYISLDSGTAIDVAARIVVDGDHFDGDLDINDQGYVIYATTDASNLEGPLGVDEQTRI